MRRPEMAPMQDGPLPFRLSWASNSHILSPIPNPRLPVSKTTRFLRSTSWDHVVIFNFLSFFFFWVSISWHAPYAPYCFICDRPSYRIVVPISVRVKLVCVIWCNVPLEKPDGSDQPLPISVENHDHYCDSRVNTQDPGWYREADSSGSRITSIVTFTIRKHKDPTSL